MSKEEKQKQIVKSNIDKPWLLKEESAFSKEVDQEEYEIVVNSAFARYTEGQKTVSPVRSTKELDNIKYYLSEQKRLASPKKFPRKARNLFLWQFGINSALRVGDILALQVKGVHKGFIDIKDEKTKKINRFEISDTLLKLIKDYVEELGLTGEDYLFKNFNQLNQPITKQGLHPIFKEIQKNCGLKYSINTHTLRKTFGYHFFQQTKDIETLRLIYNHADVSTTQKYIGLTEEKVSEARKKFTIGL